MITFKEKNINDFFEVPFHIYGKDSLYISPLKSDLKRFLSLENPLFSKYGHFTFYTAYKNEQLVGRIVCHIHTKSNERHKIKRSYFGFFDCTNDVEVARALLKKAEEFGQKNGCDELAGNFNLTAMQQIGVMVSGFENVPYTDQVYNPPYLPELLKQCGYQDYFPMTTHELDLEKFNPDSLLGPKQVELNKNSEYEFTKMTKKNLMSLLQHTQTILNDGFDLNPMFVPVTMEEFMFQAKDMMYIIDERLSHMAFHKGEPIGVLVCIPDLNPLLNKIKSRLGISVLYHYFKYLKTRDRAIIIFYSVNRKYHSLGVNGVLLHKSLTALKQAGYKKMGGTWIADSNVASLRQIQKMGMIDYHKTVLFKKSIG